MYVLMWFTTVYQGGLYDKTEIERFPASKQTWMLSSLTYGLIKILRAEAVGEKQGEAGWSCVSGIQKYMFVKMP